MDAPTECQTLIDFFTNRPLPAGPQHVNPYSVFMDLPSAVSTRLTDLQSSVPATQQAAFQMLDEVKGWLQQQKSLPTQEVTD